YCAGNGVWCARASGALRSWADLCAGKPGGNRKLCPCLVCPLHRVYMVVEQLDREGLSFRCGTRLCRYYLELYSAYYGIMRLLVDFSISHIFINQCGRVLKGIIHGGLCYCQLQ